MEKKKRSPEEDKMSGYVHIGVVGYSEPKFDKHIAQALIIKAFDQIEEANPTGGFVVISGLTDIGIHALAYREADRRGWYTKGVACRKASDYDLYEVDAAEIVGEGWGDESETFLRDLDVLVRIGGGEQSHDEAQKAEDRGVQVISYELPALPDG